MSPRNTDTYYVYHGPDDEILLRYTDESLGFIETEISDLFSAIQIAKSRSPDWLIIEYTAGGREFHRYTPNSTISHIARSSEKLKENPFYLSFKPEGQNVQRFGPMSEADMWIEDIEDELALLQTSADPTFEEVGQLLRDRRLELGLSQPQVAALADFRKQTISDIERGAVRSSQATLRQVARVLHATFDGPLPSRLSKNPSAELSSDDVEHYRFFHGVPPDKYIDMHVWIPGGMVLVGSGKDVGYGILDKNSNKDGWYVHDFGPEVKIYRRAKSGERATKTWSSFPRQVTSLGYNLGFTYIDKNGSMKEVKGSHNKYLAVTPSRRTLVVVGPKGIEYLMEGGNMRVDNWIRD